MRVQSSKPVLVGVTGGIGAGKSVVCKIFECLGVPVYYADDRAKWLMNQDAVLRSKIIKAFGEKSYNGKQLDRSFMSQHVFSNPEKLQALNQLVHPAVAMDNNIWQQKNAGHVLLVKEAALLYETGTYKQLDHTLVVAADLATRMSRVLKRDPQRTEAEVLQIIDKQMPQEDKIKRADFVIINDDDHALIDQVYEFLKMIKVDLRVA